MTARALCFLLCRVACVIPPVVAAPPSLWVARPPSLYHRRLRALRQRLREHTAPYVQQLRQLTALRSLQFPELRLVQFDSGRRTPCPRGVLHDVRLPDCRVLLV